ncbi:MAG TPA: VWA domain-containing protein [Polyangiaceae bacterium]|nr:VWA domain-containing protein [Polyangiaceae bacterium]
MSTDRAPASTPDRMDPSRTSSPSAPSARTRGLRRAAAAALLVSVACSHAVPREAPRDVARKEGGTGTRARGEEGSQGRAANAPPPVDREALTSRGSVETKSPSTASPAASGESESAKEQKAQSFGIVGQMFGEDVGAAGLGLTGRGEGGGGLGVASPVPTPKVATGQRPGVAVGRLAGAHATARAAATAGPSMPVSPSTQEREFDTEAYAHRTDNPFQLVTEAPLSTFSVDVDTASYSNMRRFVESGRRPPADAIRVEEWVNYFSYDDAPPTTDEPVAVSSEVTECPWDQKHELLRVALTTRPIAQEAVPPRNLVFLVDVSGSMEPANKLPLLKRGLAMLARNLRPADTLSIVVYAGASGVALPPTSGAEQGKILSTLGNLEAGGSTNGAEGIQLAYRLAESQFKKGGINRVVLATDGDFNVGVTSEGELTRLIEQKRKSGVFLTVLGFGEGNVKDSTMEMLADKGNGNYAYVDSLAEAKKVLVREAGATLVTVAKDVKLQLEFNPTHVKSYRLVGYENRLLADQDFNDDTKDAGEMGAGHHVTAFYEIVPAGAKEPAKAPAVDPLKYQTERAPSAAAGSDDLVTVKIRYKPPAGNESLLVSRRVLDRVTPLAQASDGTRFGAAVAEYALSLRGAPGFGKATLGEARALAAGALGADLRGERREFLGLMDKVRALPN